MDEAARRLRTAATMRAYAGLLREQGKAEAAVDMLECALVTTHSAWFAVLRDYAQRAFPQSALQERREVMPTLRNLTTGGNEGLDEGVRVLETLALRRDQAYYMDEGRERDPAVLDRWVKAAVSATGQWLETFRQRHVRRHHPAVEAQRQGRER